MEMEVKRRDTKVPLGDTDVSASFIFIPVLPLNRSVYRQCFQQLRFQVQERTHTRFFLLRHTASACALHVTWKLPIQTWETMTLHKFIKHGKFPCYDFYLHLKSMQVTAQCVKFNYLLLLVSICLDSDECRRPLYNICHRHIISLSRLFCLAYLVWTVKFFYLYLKCYWEFVTKNIYKRLNDSTI